MKKNKNMDYVTIAVQMNEYIEHKCIGFFTDSVVIEISVLVYIMLHFNYL